MVLANRRSVMTLFSDPVDLYSHQVRFVLAVKQVEADIVDMDANSNIEDLYDLNPYGTLPTFVDRDLAIYEPSIIMDYLDERFPHPPLMPSTPVARANNRTIAHRMREDWFKRYGEIAYTDNAKTQQTARKQLTESLTLAAALFTKKPFFASDDFSLLDCYIAPLLWRLPSLEIRLPESAQVIYDYAERIFKMTAFQTSLTAAERKLR